MIDPSDLETTIGRSLQSRSSHLDASTGDLDDVLTRAGRRRSRRRSVTVVGSLAAIVVGVVGVVALEEGGDSTPAGSSGSDGAAVTVEQGVPAQAAWRCDDQLAYWGETGDEVYFVSCEQTTIDGGVEVLVPPAPTAPSEQSAVTTVPASSEVIDTTPPLFTTTVPLGDPRISTVEQLYTVVAGDSVIAIAQRFGIGTDALVAYNEWPEGLSHPLFVGDEIRIPPDSRVPGSLTAEQSTTTSTTVA